MQKREIWKRWALTQEELRELFEATREHHSYDHEEELYDDDDADCICD